MYHVLQRRIAYWRTRPLYRKDLAIFEIEIFARPSPKNRESACRCFETRPHCAPADGCRLAMDAHDPTNVNAVAGPSRLAYAAPPATTTSHAAAAMQQPTASPPPRGRADGTAPTTAARKDPVRRADGPVIVPTRVDPVDNVRVVPQHFENCQLDDLISLIGGSLLHTHTDCGQSG